MSYRDLRNFTETMRLLGYPRLISIANFRLPNFQLVAEILVWLVKRFEPEAALSVEIDDEEQRVALIRNVAEFMALRTSIRLNTKKLYQADGYAVKELLKIASLLDEAQRTSTTGNSNPQEAIITADTELSSRAAQLKSTRQLASLLTSTGAALFDSLGRELELRDVRNSRLARQLDVADVENALREATVALRREIEDTKKQIENVKETEQNLDTRIERRKGELERNQKRLQTLRKVRPAFMDEFEKLEVQLRALYDDYLQKFRYLAYLEHLYEDAAKVEQERFERRQAATKKQLEKMRAEEVSFEGDGRDSIIVPPTLEEPLALTENENQRVDKTTPSARAKSGRSSRMTIRQRRVYGSMSGRQRGTIQESNDSGSLDSDSDLLIDGDLDDDLDDEDDDILDSVEGTGIGNFEMKVGQEKRATTSKIDHSDEDF